MHALLLADALDVRYDEKTVRDDHMITTIRAETVETRPGALIIEIIALEGGTRFFEVSARFIVTIPKLVVLTDLLTFSMPPH